MKKKINVAIDGFSSCGKSTMAKDLARTVGYTHIDSGAMYRAITLYAYRRGYFNGNFVDEKKLSEDIAHIEISFDLSPETGMGEICLNTENVENEIRSMDIAVHVSLIASLGFVRRALVAKQQAIGYEKGIVMDGRDIGTVVFTNAELKIFVTAAPEIRAQRRVDELITKGQTVSFADVLNNIKERDRIDTSRKESPLTKAADAIELDNSYMSVQEQRHWLLAQFKRVTEE